MQFKPFLGYMLFVTIRISRMCQKLDLIEITSSLLKFANGTTHGDETWYACV